MKPFNLIAAGAALSAGLVGGTATYLVAAQPTAVSAPSPARTTQVTTPVSAPVARKPIVKLAKCKAPAVREGKACVTEVVETVVLPAPPAPPAPPSSSGHTQIAAHDNDDHGNGGQHGTGPDDDATEGPGEDQAGEDETEDEDHADEDEPGEDHEDEDEGNDD
jgi:hypothetical protein